MLARAPITLKGQLDVGGQEHFTWKARSPTPCPGAGPVVYTSSTQHPGEVQHWGRMRWASRTTRCGWSARMGGGFGGREPRPATWRCGPRWQRASSSWGARSSCAWTATTTSWSPASATFRLRLHRGLRRRGPPAALQLMLAGQLRLQRRPVGPGGRPRGLPCDNAYYLSRVCIASYRCRTNTRAHGVPRLRRAAGHDLIEDHPRRHRAPLGLDPLDVRRRNLYGDEAQRHPLPACRWRTTSSPADRRLEASADYQRGGAAIALERRQPGHAPRPGLTPVKFGISSPPRCSTRPARWCMCTPTAACR